MSLISYLESHYEAACKLQRGIILDPLIVEMLKTDQSNAGLVKSWMLDYALFQGITGNNRDAIANCFLEFARSHVRVSHITDDVVKTLYNELFKALHKKVPRGWTSATSKLLWCLYPNDIVIYDSFVHRSLVVLQCIDNDISGFPRIGIAPQIKSACDIEQATEHYMTYQSIVRKLLSTHAKTLSALRHRFKEEYPYDIRIMDKILWMIGNVNQTV